MLWVTETLEGESCTILRGVNICGSPNVTQPIVNRHWFVSDQEKADSFVADIQYCHVSGKGFCWQVARQLTGYSLPFLLTDNAELKRILDIQITLYPSRAFLDISREIHKRDQVYAVMTRESRGVLFLQRSWIVKKRWHLILFGTTVVDFRNDNELILGTNPDIILGRFSQLS